MNWTIKVTLAKWVQETGTPPRMDVQSLVLVRIRMTPWLHGYSPAGVQPRLIQGIRSGDGVGDLFIYKYLSKI